MLNHITETIEQVTSQLGGEKGIPTDKMSQVSSETKDSVVSALKGAVSGGNFSQITDLIGGKTAASSSPMVSNIINSLIPKLTGKLGIDKGVAEKFSHAAIPKIMGLLNNKHHDSSSEFDAGGLLNSLGGDAGGIVGKIGGMFGG